MLPRCCLPSCWQPLSPRPALHVSELPRCSALSTHPLQTQGVLSNTQLAACPCRVTFALEEKNLPYDSVLIDLRKKPHWYKDIVPTELTPAAVVNGKLVYESLDILKVRPSYSCLHSHTVVPAASEI